MRILPVIDLKDGLVVRGVAGRRAEYRPIVSQLCDSAEPFAVARAFRDHFGFQELYLADLDAIAGQPPALIIYEALRTDGFRLWVDAGIRDADDARRLSATVDGIVVGLETVSGPESLAAICGTLGPDQVVFSLDLKDGRPLGNGAAWKENDPLRIAGQALACGLHKLLVLDLSRVGMGSGTGSEAICTELLQRHPGIELWAGGGVRDATDLRRLHGTGLHTVLIASALHDGRITQSDFTH